MLSKFVEPGHRVEIQPVERVKGSAQDDAPKIYFSQVYDILSEDQLELTMPMEQTKLILLPVDGELDLVFYGIGGLYQCYGRVVDRYKSSNVYLMLVELTSELRKYQRREYYRYNCALELHMRELTGGEQQIISERRPFVPEEGIPAKRGVIVDISGGGLRFMCAQKYEQDALLYCRFQLSLMGKARLYEVASKVLQVKEVENRPDTFEHRVMFVDMEDDVREEIIRYIFEAERRSIKREKKL